MDFLHRLPHELIKKIVLGDVLELTYYADILTHEDLVNVAKLNNLEPPDVKLSIRDQIVQLQFTAVGSRPTVIDVFALDDPHAIVVHEKTNKNYDLALEAQIRGRVDVVKILHEYGEHIPLVYSKHYRECYEIVGKSYALNSVYYDAYRLYDGLTIDRRVGGTLIIDLEYCEYKYARLLVPYFTLISDQFILASLANSDWETFKNVKYEITIDTIDKTVADMTYEFLRLLHENGLISADLFNYALRKKYRTVGMIPARITVSDPAKDVRMYVRGYKSEVIINRSLLDEHILIPLYTDMEVLTPLVYRLFESFDFTSGLLEGVRILLGLPDYQVLLQTYSREIINSINSGIGRAHGTLSHHRLLTLERKIKELECPYFKIVRVKRGCYAATL